MVPRLWLPRSLMYWQMALLEPLQRMLGLPAFLSRETVEVTKAHLNYSSAKAKRYLGWVHPEVEEVWERIISDERRLMASRRGFLNKLRHQPTVFNGTVVASFSQPILSSSNQRTRRQLA